jgi:hypothetical protein
MSSSNLSELFKSYDSAHQEWLDAKRLVEEKYKQQSEIVENIFRANTNNKTIKRRTPDGNFQQLTICRRGQSWFFRGAKDEGDVVE